MKKLLKPGIVLIFTLSSCVGLNTAEKPGNTGAVVIGPSGKLVNVEGIPPGTLCEDPSSGQRFRVPTSTVNAGGKPLAVVAVPGANGMAYTPKPPAQPSAASKFGKGVFGFLGDLGGAVVGAAAENPQLLASVLAPSSSGASRSSSSSNALAMQQLSSSSAHTTNSSIARSTNSMPAASSGNPASNNSSSTGSPTRNGSNQSNEDTTMLGPLNGGGSKGPVSVSFHCSRITRGSAIVHEEVAKKHSWVIARGYVSGYGRSLNGGDGFHTDKFEIMFSKNGPYTKNSEIFFCTGSWDFSRGYKVIQITSVSYVK